MSLPKDFAYGIIPLHFEKKQWYVFLVQHNAGHWSFPKGHAESSLEAPRQTAERELFEETGLSVADYMPCDPLEVHYECMSHGNRVAKTVQFFLATVQGDVVLQVEEVCEGKWMTIQQAREALNFEQMQRLVDELVGVLKTV